MILSLEPGRPLLRALLLGAFLLFLFAPLAVVAVFAFNDANYPAPPWRGFVLDWFIGNAERGRVGLLQDGPLLGSIATSSIVALWVATLSVVLGTAAALLLERARFPGKGLLSTLLLVPLVIPGVILGVSLLSLASTIAQLADDWWGLDLDFLRPGLPLIVCGQVSFMAAISTLTIAARLKRLDPGLERGGIGSWRQPLDGLLHDRPALPAPRADRQRRRGILDVVREFQHDPAVSGSDPPLTVFLYGRMREGATPVVNAVSLLLMVASALAAVLTRRRSTSP